MFVFTAKRKLTIGSDVVEPGDLLTEAVIAQLPPGRLAQLAEHGYVEQQSDQEALIHKVLNLEARVAKLEALLNGPARRPGRPMKVKEDTEDARVLS